MLAHAIISPLPKRRGRPRKNQPMDLSIDCAAPPEFGEGRTLKGEEFRLRKAELEREDRERREKAR